MFSLSSVVESVFGTLAAEETMPQSRAHDEDRSATSTDTIDNPEDAKANVQELQDKQDEADGAEDEDEEEVPDVSLYSRSSCRSKARRSPATLEYSPTDTRTARPQQGDEIREGASPRPSLSLIASPLSPTATLTRAKADPLLLVDSVRQHQGVQGVQAPL